jgi:hypothetical protein
MNILLKYAGRIVTIVLAIAVLRALVKIMMDEKKKKDEQKTVTFEAATPEKNTKIAPMTPDDTNAGKVPWTNMDPKKAK